MTTPQIPPVSDQNLMQDGLKYRMARLDRWIWICLSITLPACLSYLGWCGVQVKRSHDSTTLKMAPGIIEDARLIIWSDSSTQAGRVERARIRIQKRKMDSTNKARR